MADQILQAVNALYHHPDDSVKKQANEWLEAWQQSPDAWSIASAVLRDSNAGLDAQYFSAQTLRTKVRQDFEELPPESVSSLCNSLLEALQLFANQPLVRTQLSLAFAALVAHLPREHWGPQGMLSWLVKWLEPLPQSASVPIMLELMQIFPEEANSYLPSVRPERRRELTEDLRNSAPMALQILTTCLSSTDKSHKAKVLEAFARWMNLAPYGGLPDAVLGKHPLVDATIEALKSEDLFNEAVEVMIELIYATSDKGHPGADSMTLISRIVPAVLELLPRFERCVQSSQGEGNADDEEDEDFARGTARLFVELGEAYTTMIASGSQDAVRPVEALLQVAAHADEEVCSMSFNFWHRLSQQLTSGFSSNSSSGREETKKEIEARCAPFLPAFIQLVRLLNGRLRYKDFNGFEQLHDEEQEEFRRFRYGVSDTLLDAAYVLGEDRVLMLLTETLQAIAGQSGSVVWEAVEASLHCIRSVHRIVKTPQQPVMLNVLQVLPELPKIPKLQYTAAMLIQAYGPWIDSSLGSTTLQNVMPQLLKMLSEDLTSTEPASAAALAIKNLCESCGRRMAPYLEALTQLYSQVQESGIFASKQQPFTLDEEDVQQIMQAVVVIVASLPEEQRRSAFASMLSPLVQNLRLSLEKDRRTSQASATTASSSKAEQDNQTLALFDRLTVILRYVDDAGAATDALTQIQPLIEVGMQQYSHSASAVERIIRSLRYGLRTCGKDAANGKLVDLLMTAIPRWFSAAPHCCYIYLASELVKIFGGSPQQEASLARLAKEMLLTSCQGLQRLQDFTNNPDVADDTFLLVGRLLSYAPLLLLNDAELVAAVLKSAQAGVLVLHREANESVLTILSRMMDAQTLARLPKPITTQLVSIVEPMGPTLIRLYLAAASGMVPSSRIVFIGEAVVHLLKLSGEKGLQWFCEAVQCLPEKSASKQDLEYVMKAGYNAAKISDSVSSFGLMESALSELSELVRRNKRSEELAQDSLLPPALKHALF